MEWFTADSFKGWTILREFEENGKMYADAKNICSKCSGKGIAISHVENGVPIPYFPDNGVCYSCEGKGYFYKKIRLYTKAEYDKMSAIKEKNRIKKAEAQEKKMKEEFDTKKSEWLEKEGFNDNLTTFVVTGDSYSIKEELKAAGFRFNNHLKWHRATPGEFPCIEIKAEEVLDFSAWGTGSYHADAQKVVQDKLDALKPKSTSEWIGEKGDRITDLLVIVKNIHGYESRYGYGRIYTFEDENSNIIKWFTSSNPQIDAGEQVLMSATIKELSEYKGEKQTIINRPKFKSVE